MDRKRDLAAHFVAETEQSAATEDCDHSAFLNIAVFLPSGIFRADYIEIQQGEWKEKNKMNK